MSGRLLVQIFNTTDFSCFSCFHENGGTRPSKWQHKSPTHFCHFDCRQHHLAKQHLWEENSCSSSDQNPCHYGHQRFIQCSQDPNTGPYPETHKSEPKPSTLFTDYTPPSVYHACYMPHWSHSFTFNHKWALQLVVLYNRKINITSITNLPV